MKAYRKIPNLNILPKEHYHLPVSLLQLCLIAVIIAAGTLGGLAYFQWSEDLDTKDRLNSELANYTITTELQGKVTQVVLLKKDITALQTELDKLEEALTEVQSSQLDLPTLYSAILTTTGDDPSIDSITQNKMKITIIGTYSNLDKLSGYQVKLRNLDMVTSAKISSIEAPEFVIELVLQGS